jgi:hypothetical protein
MSKELGMVSHSCIARIWEAQPGGSGAQGQPRLHSKTLVQKKKNEQRILIAISQKKTYKWPTGI